jgi:hypothetical protein
MKGVVGKPANGAHVYEKTPRLAAADLPHAAHGGIALFASNGAGTLDQRLDHLD